MYCRSSLAVRRTGSAVYTEVLNRLDERTERMSEDLVAIRLHSELERMDREWQQTEEKLDAETRALARTLAKARSEKPGFVLPILGLIMGVVLLFVLAPYGMRVGSPLIEAILIGWSGIALAVSIGKARRLERLEEGYNSLRESCITAEQEFRDRRAEIARRLDGR
jgi:hypothetical protein